MIYLDIYNFGFQESAKNLAIQKIFVNDCYRLNHYL